jgi:MYXO-CTERM domain-containing protein
MKHLFNLSLVFLLSSIALDVDAQGSFVFNNLSAPTRIGASNGPLAGAGIWGQMLAGSNVNSLFPVGSPAEHFPNGIADGGRVMVPGIAAYNYAQVQMVAWDSAFWGTSLAGVPTDQLGRTDIVSVFLTTGVFPDVAFLPQFTQPAIVPPIPEPSVWALAVLALGALGMRRFVRKAIK